MCMPFFIMEMFVGVVVENFTETKHRLGQYGFLSKRQMEWVLTRRRMANMRPLVKNFPPEGRFRRACFGIAQSSVFESIVFGIIILNTITLMFPYFGASTEYT